MGLCVGSYRAICLNFLTIKFLSAGAYCIPFIDFCSPPQRVSFHTTLPRCSFPHDLAPFYEAG